MRKHPTEQWRRRLETAALVSCLGGCAPAPAPEPATGQLAIDPDVEFTRFTATSLDNTFFAFVAEFEAGFHVGDDSIVVVVYTSRIRLREATDVRGPRLLDSIQVRLARASGPTWTLGEKSAPVVVAQTMQPGTEIPLDSLRFSVARPDGPLDQEWLVFELVGRLIGADGRPGNPGSAFVHSRRSVFQR